MYVLACLLFLTTLGCLRDEYPERLGTSPDSTDIPVRQGDLRVITYNLYCWNACPKGYGYVKAWLEKVLPTTDVIAFQEFECNQCGRGNIRHWLTGRSFGGKQFKAVTGTRSGNDVYNYPIMYVDTTTTVTASDFDRIGTDQYGGRYVQTATVQLANGHTLKLANHHGCIGSHDSGCRGGGADAIFEELEAHDFFEGDTSVFLCDCNDMQHYMYEFCDYGFEYQKTKSGGLAGFDNIAWNAQGMTYMQAFQYDGKGYEGASDHQGLVIDFNYGADPCDSSCRSCVEGSETVCASCPKGKVLVDGVCTEGLCNEQDWPDLDHNLVCGDCKVLVNNFQTSYGGTCSQYCGNLGLECVGAWDEDNDSCSELFTMTCDQFLASSDAICECGDASSQDPSVPQTTEEPEEDLCDEESWPDLDHGLVCGDCKVLVDNFARVYGTCSQYCESMGFECVGAWEEDADTCGVLYDLTCDETLASSDAICECSPNTSSNTKEPTMSAAATTAEPTVVSACDESSWPNVDHNLVCGECKVLVDNFESVYGGTCSGYCNALGLTCKGGWEEVNDTCEEAWSIGCSEWLSTSDAICQCFPDAAGEASCGAEVPEDCSEHIRWAQNRGRRFNPSWYPHFEETTGVALEDSTFEDMTLYFACKPTGHEECADIELPCGRSCGH